MKEPLSPCLFCDEKEVGCHIDCKKYNSFREEHHKWKIKVGQEKQKEYIIDSVKRNKK